MNPAYAAAREICRRHARSLYLASWFLPLEKRRAAHSVVAFCQMIREAIDVPASALAGARGLREHPAVASPRSLRVIDPEPAPAHCSIDTAESRIEMLRQRLDELYAGRVELPSPHARSETQHALCAFQQTVSRVEIPRQYFIDLAEGCRRNLSSARPENWAELKTLCEDTGGMFALIVACVLGLQHSDAFAQAVVMGSAMRLTSILGNLKQDASQGRIYLPRDEMEEFGYCESDVRKGVVNDGFCRLMRLQIGRARAMYRQGANALCWLAGDGSRLMASAMALLQSGILDSIERQRYDVYARPPKPTPLQQFRCLPIAWRLARREPDQPLPDVF